MTLFESLVVTHLLGDFVLQTEYEAMNKMKGSFLNRALFSHCLTYALCFIPVLWHFQLSLYWLAIIFGSHMFLDRRWPIVWWITTVKRTSKETLEKICALAGNRTRSNLSCSDIGFHHHVYIIIRISPLLNRGLFDIIIIYAGC